MQTQEIKGNILYISRSFEENPSKLEVPCRYNSAQVSQFEMAQIVIEGKSDIFCGTSPHLIVIDKGTINPETLAFCEWSKTTHPHIPIIYTVSAREQMGAIRTIKKIGVDNLIRYGSAHIVARLTIAKHMPMLKPIVVDIPTQRALIADLTDSGIEKTLRQENIECTSMTKYDITDFIEEITTNDYLSFIMSVPKTSRRIIDNWTVIAKKYAPHMQLITISDGLIGAMDVPHQIHLCEAKKGHLLYAIEQAQKNYTDNLEKLLTITKPAIHLLGSPRSSGKTEITKRLLATNPLLKQVLNYTTRKKRGEEAATHHFVEHLPIGCYEYEYTGAKYGYVFEDIEDVLLQKRDVLLVVTPYEVFNDITNRMGRKEALNLLQVYSILMDQRAMQEQITATREGVENDPHINEEYEKYTKDTFAQMVHTIPNINTGADNKYGLYAALNSIQHLFTQHRHL